MNIREYDILPLRKGKRIRCEDGEVYGKLTVIECVGMRRISHRNAYECMYSCDCECGEAGIYREDYLRQKRSYPKCNRCIGRAKAYKGRKTHSVGADVKDFPKEQVFFVSKLPVPESVEEQGEY